MKTSLLLIGMFLIALAIPDVESRCPTLKIKNGYTRRKPGNRIAFFCVRGYSRYGSRTSVCDGNRWKSSPPICVAPGCPKVPISPRRDMDFIHNEAVVMFTCLDAFVLVGKATAYCDGEHWSSPAPDCQNPGNIDSCDFEDGEFCGWEQDQMDDFDWSRHSGRTISGNTGPDSDHTLGPTRLGGHYIYMESSAPRVAGHIARLLSPVYKQSKSGRCFRFWYHMKGPSGDNLVGSLTISLRVYNGSLAVTDDVLFTVKENQGPDWKEGQVFVYRTDTPFRIVLTATRQQSYISDIAVDDVRLYDCPVVITTKSSSAEMTSHTEEIEITEMTTVSETTQLSTTDETTKLTSEATQLSTTDETTKLTSEATQLSTTDETTKQTVISETTTTEVTQTSTGHDVTSTSPKKTSSLPVSTTVIKLMTQSNTKFISSTSAFNMNSGNDVIDLSTPFSSSFPGSISENTESTQSKLTSDSSDLNQSHSITTVREDSTEEVTTTSFSNISDTKHAYRYTPKPGVKQFILQNNGVIHSVSFVVSLTIGIAVVVIGALVIAFIVRRMKKRTKHYTDDDFETMHTATYRKQSTDGLI